MSFQFNILALLGNISTRITLYELLHLSKTTRDALWKVLAHSEAFLAYLLEETDEAYVHCNLVARHTLSITFTLEEMLLKNIKHDRSLYYTWYLCSMRVGWIQVDLGFTLSIMP